MDTITRETLRELISEKQQWCVSMYMPAHRAGRQTKQDRVRFKNQIAAAQKGLEHNGMKREHAEAMLAPARNLHDDNEFWQHQSDGLAVVITPDRLRHWRLPVSFSETVVVDERPHIKPLIPAVGGDVRFYVLALSQNRIRLFQGARFTIDEIDPASAPKNLADALRYDDPERNVQFHTKTSGGPNQNRPAIFHGQGKGQDYANRRLALYYQKVEHGIREVLDGDNAPLVLAGVEHLLPVYREVNEYPYLADKAITGSAEHISAEELHARALEIVEPIFERAQRDAAERFRELAESRRETALADVKSVISAAQTGRVAALFVAAGVQQWGTVDPRSKEINIHQSQEPGDEDLLDRAVLETLTTGGEVFTVSTEKVPSRGYVAALLRY